MTELAVGILVIGLVLVLIWRDVQSDFKDE